MSFLDVGVGLGYPPTYVFDDFLNLQSSWEGSWSGLMDEDRNRLNCKVSPEGQCGTEKHECLGKADSLVPL